MSYTSLTQDDARSVLARGDALVLDVRTPEEYATLGHLPGARLLPVQCIASAPAVLPRDGRPILVYCEHGVRSRHAADVLVRTGFSNVLELAHGMAEWHGDRAFGEGAVWGPSSWVLEHAAQYQGARRVLDVAAGRGRHTLLFAAAGFEVTAVDRDGVALEELASSAAGLGVHVDIRDADLEANGYTFEGTWDVVVVTRYLHRSLFPALREAVAPGGLLVYETFTMAQRDEPTGSTSPEFLLQPGELQQLVAPLDVVAAYEGETAGEHTAGIVARNQAGTSRSA